MSQRQPPRPAPDKPLPEEALDRFIGAVDGPVNRVLERAMKSRVLLAPMGLAMTASFTALKAWRDATTTTRAPPAPAAPEAPRAHAQQHGAAR